MSLKRLVAPGITLIVVATSLVVGMATPVSAQPTWTEPDTISADKIPYSAASSGAGHLYAVFSGVAYTRNRSGSWKRLPERAPAGESEVVVDRSGNVTVVHVVEGWCEGDDDLNLRPSRDFVVRAAYRPHGGSWREQTIEGQWHGCSWGDVQVTVDEAGAVTAVWQGDGLLHTAHRRPGGTWSKPSPLGEVAGGTYDVVADGEGRAVAAWLSPDRTVMAAARSSSGGWSAPRSVAPGPDEAGVGRLQLELTGGSAEPVLATWLESLGSMRDLLVRAAARGVDGRWRAPETVATTPPAARARHVDAVVRDGVATVVWVQWNRRSASGAVRASSMPRSRWTDPVILGGALPRTTVPSVAANRLGVMAAWTAGDETSAYTMSARLGQDGRWRDRRRVGPSSRVIDEQRWSESDGAPEILAYRPKMFTVLYNRPGAGFSDFVDDTNAPRARVGTPGTHYLGLPWMPVRWSGADDLTGPRDFDVRVRSAGRGGKLSEWTIWQRRTRDTRGNHRVEPQRTYCFSTRARDRAGNVGRWSGMRCVATPIDDRAFVATSQWKRIDGANSYRQTLTQTQRHGAELSVRGVGARRVSLVARTCPSCGAVRVWHGDRDLGRVDLASDTVRTPRVIRLRSYAKRSRASVVIRVVSRGKPVQIDGVIARR